MTKYKPLKVDKKNSKTPLIFEPFFKTFKIITNEEFSISSRLLGRIDFINDESFHQMKVISDYYLASGLESRGDSSCCDEKVGGYTIGHLGDFNYTYTAQIDGDKVKFDGHEFKINDPYKSVGIIIEDNTLFSDSPNSLARLQRDIAQLFTLIHPDFLKDVFGIDCGPGCSVDVDCYYNCGYYGECHDDGDGFIDDNGNSNGLYVQNNEMQDVNYELVDGLGSTNSNIGNEKDKRKSIFKIFIPTESVKIFPNPLDDSNDLIVQFPPNDFISLHIISPSGVILQSIDIGAKQSQSLVNGSSLNTGLNYIILRSIDGSVFVEKVIKL